MTNSDPSAAPSASQPTTMADAAEMLWVVLANVSGGNWQEQSPEWQDAAARWRDNYFAAVAACPPPSEGSTIVYVKGHEGKPVAAPCCLSGCQYPDSPPPSAALERLRVRIRAWQEDEGFGGGYSVAIGLLGDVADALEPAPPSAPSGGEP